MENEATWGATTKEALLTALIVTALVLFLPMLALVGLSLQFAFVVGVPLAALLTLTSPRFRRWLLPAAPAKVRGVSIASGLAMHRAHTWLRTGQRRAAVVGVDDFLQRVLGPVDEVVLPEAGRSVRKGEVLATLRRGQRRLGVVAPATGQVVRVNDVLRRRPELVNRSPFDAGWLAEVQVESADLARSGLIEFGDAISWIKDEIDRLASLISATGAPQPALADGGELVQSVSDEVDEATWEKLSQELFQAR